MYNRCMILIRTKATDEQLKEMSKQYDGYIKIVVDLTRGIIAGGGERHVDGEQALLADGSTQKDLWGGGFDRETKEIDYNSMINLRPGEGNPSRDIVSADIRTQFDAIVKRLLI